MSLPAPYPWFGGKARVAGVIWRRLGDVDTYIEPFFGGGAVLLARPHKGERRETINDIDAMVCNFWRAVKSAPDAVAEACDWPCNEADLTARHIWLVNRKPEIAERCMADPEWFDARAAGWWCWGQCWWIGPGWCSGNGKWNTDGERLVAVMPGVVRGLPHIGNDGRGVARKLPGGGACENYSAFIGSYIRRLSDRFRRVRVCCGDWSRITGPSAAGYKPSASGSVGVFLDPPYSHDTGRYDRVYAHDSAGVAHEVRAWCVKAGADPRLRIALCGYDTEHAELEALGWSVFAWKTAGGMARIGNARGRDNAERERIWFSPACIADESVLFERAGAAP